MSTVFHVEPVCPIDGTVRRETRVGLGQDRVRCDHVDSSFHLVIVLTQHQLSPYQAQGKHC